MRANLLKRKISLRIKRKKRIRAKISGTAALPRISVFKSTRTLYIQAIDDVNHVTLACADGKKLGCKANIEGAKKIGAAFADTLKKAGIQEGIYDRNGYLYHGVIAALATSLRDNGIKL